jgi:hypothetical protein
MRASTDDSLKMRHDRFEHRVAEAFRDEGWSVEVEPAVGLYRPDLVLTSPEGRTIVAEIKLANRPVDFTWIGQASAMRSGLAAAGRSVDGAVLITTGAGNADIARLAEKMAVQIVHAEGLDDHASVRRVVSTVAAR